jgi:uncharacterized protein (TIGR02594 family)
VKWYELARADLATGVAELPGAANNDAILQYYRDVGVPQKNEEVSWCAAFVGSCLERSKIKSTRDLTARSYLSWGRKLETPREGCVVVFWRESPKSWKGHVAFYVRQTKNYVYVLGGNQKDKVSIEAYPKDKVLGYRWPIEVPEDIQPSLPFEVALEAILPLEGGYTNHPRDPGGPTNKGITLAEYATFLGERRTKDSEAGLIAKLKAIPDEHVRAIYRRSYWEPAQCPEVPLPIAVFLMDTAVLHGVPKARRYLQEALGVEVDGVLGPKTLAAAQKEKQVEVLKRFRDIRIRQLKKSKNWDVFGEGWTSRVNAILEEALEHAPVVEEKKVVPMTVDTSNEQLGKPWTQSLTIWGTIITFLSAVLPTLAPLIGIPITADMVHAFGDSVTVAIQAIGGVVGTIMTIYGRWRADVPLSQTTVKVKI